MTNESNNQIIIYESDGGHPNISVTFEGDTVWLNQAQLVSLYQSSKANVSEHIKNIFKDGELEKKAVVRKFRITGSDKEIKTLEKQKIPINRGPFVVSLTRILT